MTGHRGDAKEADEMDKIEQRARELHASDWVGPCPADAWDGLTLGEQAEYRERARRALAEH
jgi:hypothetical protein